MIIKRLGIFSLVLTALPLRQMGPGHSGTAANDRDLSVFEMYVYQFLGVEGTVWVLHKHVGSESRHLSRRYASRMTTKENKRDDIKDHCY
jgi:hypothetical protein